MPKIIEIGWFVTDLLKNERVSILRYTVVVAIVSSQCSQVTYNNSTHKRTINAVLVSCSLGAYLVIFVYAMTLLSFIMTFTYTERVNYQR